MTVDLTLMTGALKGFIHSVEFKNILVNVSTVIDRRSSKDNLFSLITALMLCSRQIAIENVFYSTLLNYQRKAVKFTDHR